MKRSTAKNLINGTVAAILITTSVSVGMFIGKYERPAKDECPHCHEEIMILDDGTIYTPPITETVVVGYGDTLWEICREYCPDNMDIREYIAQIERFNNINANVYRGQKIKMLIIE